MLAEDVARSRAASLARVQAAARFAPPDVATIQAEATARAFTSIPSAGAALVAPGRALPPAVQALAGLRVNNDKLWDADVRPIKRPILTDGWLARVRSLARGRVLGDPFATTIMRVAELLVWQFNKARQGFARLTHDALAELAQIDPGTVRRAIRWLEGRRLVDTFNVLHREDGFVRRGANLYLFRRDDLPEDPLPEPRDEFEKRSSDKLLRYARLFGLRARAWGLNATPQAWRRSPSPAYPVDPAPA